MGLPFDLKISDMVLPTVCPLLGITLNTDFAPGSSVGYAVVDMLDSAKGFLRGNVRVISWRAAVLKSFQLSKLERFLEASFDPAAAIPHNATTAELAVIVQDARVMGIR